MIRNTKFLTNWACMVFANEGMMLQDNCNIQIDNLKGLNLKKFQWISLNYTPENTVLLLVEIEQIKNKK